MGCLCKTSWRRCSLGLVPRSTLANPRRLCAAAPAAMCYRCFVPTLVQIRCKVVPDSVVMRSRFWGEVPSKKARLGHGFGFGSCSWPPLNRSDVEEPNSLSGFWRLGEGLLCLSDYTADDLRSWKHFGYSARRLTGGRDELVEGVGARGIHELPAEAVDLFSCEAWFGLQCLDESRLDRAN